MIEEIEKATNFFAESQKIGEGGYGPVYRCYLDHTPVAVKVLRPNAAHGRSQFQQEEIWRTTPKVFWRDFLKSLTIVTLIGTLIEDKSSGFYK
ncbi:hypothetical protein CMV_009943 [Castanea mollissima]|uniref:RING-type E3 ubiquitin transferase n=1 Tax=Castanea mollissima TaxID=60419 RepID=A0A8J4R9U4_9ROSI|nr:hypothetical protein CMV_009943 [Castanea mollissima]